VTKAVKSKEEKHRVSLKSAYVWGVNSTVTKHIDYFVFTNMSEHAVRHCDNLIWQRASSSYPRVLKHRFLEGVKQHKQDRQNDYLEMLFWRAANLTFSKIRDLHRKLWTKIVGFWNRTSRGLIKQFGAKHWLNLRCCLLHSLLVLLAGEVMSGENRCGCSEGQFCWVTYSIGENATTAEYWVHHEGHTATRELL